MVRHSALAHVDLGDGCPRERPWWRLLASLHSGGSIRRGTRRRGSPERARSGSRGTSPGRSFARRRPAPRESSFSLAIVEPGAPLVLGLRRTLAFQIVEAATGVNPFPRAAVWALMAGLLGLCGWLVFRWKGAAPILAEPSGSVAAPELDRRRRRSSPLAFRCLRRVLLAIWAIVAWLPIVGLFRLAPAAAELRIRPMPR